MVSPPPRAEARLDRPSVVATARREGVMAKRKNGLGVAWSEREAELAAMLDVVGNPFIYLDKKLIKILHSYKTRSDNFCPIKVDHLDQGPRQIKESD
jgi:hypothetical protein